MPTQIPERKTTNKFIKLVVVDFLNLRGTFYKKSFCNLTNRSFIIFADSREKCFRVGIF